MSMFWQYQKSSFDVRTYAQDQLYIIENCHFPPRVCVRWSPTGEEKLVASKWCFFRWFFILGHGCFTMLNAKRRLRLVVSPSSLVIFQVSPSQRIQHFLLCSAFSQGNTCILSFLNQISACAAIDPEDSQHCCQGWYLTLAGPIWAAFLVALVAQWQIFGPLTGPWDQ